MLPYEEHSCRECGRTAGERIVGKFAEFWLCNDCFPTFGLHHCVEPVVVEVIFETMAGRYERAVEILEEPWQRYRAVACPLLRGLQGR